jgi:predicted NUDIX family NTP pyrophosphohydrolase
VHRNAGDDDCFTLLRPGEAGPGPGRGRDDSPAGAPDPWAQPLRDLDELQPDRAELDHVSTRQVRGDDLAPVDIGAVGAAVIEQAAVAAVADDDGVVTGDAVVVETDFSARAASQVRDVLIEVQELRLLAVVKGEIGAAKRKIRRDRARTSAMVEEREGIEFELGPDRLDRFRGGGLDFEAKRPHGGGLCGLWGHDDKQTGRLQARRRRTLRGREEARFTGVPSRPSNRSAGLLLHRRRAGGLEVLLVHPGGPFWARRDEGAWSIPKGEYGVEEDPLVAARREFEEELGTPPPEGPTEDLGEIRQKAGKVVRAFALAAELEVESIVSNTFELEWPPRSGRMIDVPEIDRAEWFTIEEAGKKINSAQAELLERLAASTR